MKKCTSCGTQVSKGYAEFKCPKCGKETIVRCPHCRSLGTKYVCGECGFSGP